jgi:hypothetical protein
VKLIRNICELFSFIKSISSERNLLYIILNAQQLDELLLIAGEAGFEALKVNHDRSDYTLVVVLIAIDVVRRAQNLSVDGSVAIHNLEQFVEELNPLLFLREVDAVAGLLIHQFRFDDHRDDA